MQQTRIVPFNFDNLPEFFEVVKDMWSPSEGEEHYKKLYVEMILRNNIHENEFRFQLEDADSGNPFSAAFFMKKGDISTCREWLETQKHNLSKEEQRNLDSGYEYLEYMDDRTLSLMNEDDIKLCLFISRKAGYGSILLNEMKEKFRMLGYKRLFLWTDCECNWQWYEKNGYTLLCKEDYEKFSTPESVFTYYIFSCAL